MARRSRTIPVARGGLSVSVDVVIRPDCNGFDLLLRTDDVFQRRAELDGKPPVSNEYQANHIEIRTPADAVPRAATKGGHHDHVPGKRKGDMRRPQGYFAAR